MQLLNAFIRPFKNMFRMVKKAGPVHAHTTCKHCHYVRTDKLDTLDVDIYICRKDGSDLWKVTLVYGPLTMDYKTRTICI